MCPYELQHPKSTLVLVGLDVAVTHTIKTNEGLQNSVQRDIPTTLSIVAVLARHVKMAYL